mmetsp:Transcript_152964/g.267322  ORF Transcript_152964/g.267322 Transcript_152964/m.267322 type:complete len:237 (+) Transcript_152964:476-1186(+)
MSRFMSEEWRQVWDRLVALEGLEFVRAVQHQFAGHWDGLRRHQGKVHMACKVAPLQPCFNIAPCETMPKVPGFVSTVSNIAIVAQGERVWRWPGAGDPTAVGPQHNPRLEALRGVEAERPVCPLQNGGVAERLILVCAVEVTKLQLRVPFVAAGVLNVPGPRSICEVGRAVHDFERGVAADDLRPAAVKCDFVLPLTKDCIDVPFVPLFPLPHPVLHLDPGAHTQGLGLGGGVRGR